MTRQMNCIFQLLFENITSSPGKTLGSRMIDEKTRSIMETITEEIKAEVKVAGAAGWAKWQIGLCVGAPIALGLAGLYWMYGRKRSDEDGVTKAQTSGSKLAGKVACLLIN